MEERHYYAWIEVREYGEPDREVRVGPYSAEDPDDLAYILAMEGDMVLRVEEAA